MLNQGLKDELQKLREPPKSYTEFCTQVHAFREKGWHEDGGANSSI